MPNNNSGDRNNSGNQGGQKSQTGSQQQDFGSPTSRDSSRDSSSRDSSSRDKSREVSAGSSSGSRNQSSQQSSGSRGSDINLRLTPEQQAQIRQATGKNLQSLSLSVEDIGQESGSAEHSEESSSRSYQDETSEDERGMAEE